MKQKHYQSFEESDRLRHLARIIRNGGATIKETGAVARTQAEAAVAEIVLTGNAMLEVKTIIGAGRLPEWLAEHAKKVSGDDAAEFMRIAKLDLTAPNAVRRSYVAAGILPG